MDVFTHFALPYLALWALRRPSRERVAAGLGGYAPDLDVLTAIPAAFVPQLYMLGHRGISHTLVGAPLYALALFVVLQLPFWSRLTPRAAALRFTPRLMLLGLASSYTHLLLDWTTMWGVALLYPWSFERFTANWFFYSVAWMIPASGYLVWRVFRGTATDVVIRRTGAVILSILLVSGAVRAATYPGAPEGGVAQPASGDWAWTVLAPRPDGGYDATFRSWGRIVGNATYEGDPPATADEEAAVAAARASLAYKDFHLYAGGPQVLQVEPREEGGHNVTFLDLMQRTQADRSSLDLPFWDDRGALRLAVTENGEVHELE